jgi:hypothetical protein
MELSERIEEMKCIYKVIASISRNRSLVGHGLTWDIRMDLRNIGCKGIHYVHLTQDRISWRVLAVNVNIYWVP